MKIRIFIICFLFLGIMKLQSQEKPLPPEAPVPTLAPYQVTAKEEKEYLSKFNEQIRKQLEEIKKMDKYKYAELLRDAYFKNMELPLFNKTDKEARERDRKIIELEISSENLGLKYQNDSTGNRQKIKQELRNKLNELFELREKERKLEFENLENRLNELRETLEDRRKNKDEIVKNRLLELTGEEKHLKW